MPKLICACSLLCSIFPGVVQLTLSRCCWVYETPSPHQARCSEALLQQVNIFHELMLHVHLRAVLVAGHIRGQDDPSRFLCPLTKRDTPSTSMDTTGFCRMERQFFGLNTSQQNSGERDSTALRQKKHHSVQTMLKRSTSIARTVQRSVSCGLLNEHERCTKLRIETTQGLLAQE
jgi:hypothetical protein